MFKISLQKPKKQNLEAKKSNNIASDNNIEKNNSKIQNNQIKSENKEVKKDSRNFFEKLFNINTEQKKIELQNIKDFNWAISWINYFIKIKDFDRANDAIEEVLNKEKDAYNQLISKIDLPKEKQRLKNNYEGKLSKVKRLKTKLDKEEIEYNEKMEIDKFKAKFEQIKLEMESLIWLKKISEALDLINTFFEWNKESVVVMKFYNKWKKILQKKFKQQLEEKEKELAKNAKKEAEVLIWENIENVISNVEGKKEENKIKGEWFIKSLINKFSLYRKVKKRLYERKLIDEVNLLIDTQKEVDEISKKSRVESMHLWLVKEISKDRLLGYDLYAKILWKDKISWDAFWFSEDEQTYKFFLWDATWHWVKAWLMVTLVTRLFYNLAKISFLEKLAFEINNWLKQDLRSWNFITWLFFEIRKDNLNYVKYVWMWHEPILVYRKNTWEIEKYISWWLAAWIRLIDDIHQIKSRALTLWDWDIIIIYSDWIVESRNRDNKLLWVDGFVSIVKKSISKTTNIYLLYKEIVESIKDYRWGNVNFYDDATIFMVKRNFWKDLVNKKSLYLKDLSMKEWLTRQNMRELEWKTKEEVEKELIRIRKQKQLNLILKNLENLYITWEILKLKQESIRYIKEWYVHKKINDYLKKAISKEKQYKIDLKEQKMMSKYKILKDMLKKWDYNTVISEVNDIIVNDWNITI